MLIYFPPGLTAVEQGTIGMVLQHRGRCGSKLSLLSRVLPDIPEIEGSIHESRREREVDGRERVSPDARIDFYRALSSRQRLLGYSRMATVAFRVAGYDAILLDCVTVGTPLSCQASGEVEQVTQWWTTH